MSKVSKSPLKLSNTSINILLWTYSSLLDINSNTVNKFVMFQILEKAFNVSTLKYIDFVFKQLNKNWFIS